jgi:uncharacterized protein involved in outer membrane biogenesis
MLKIGTIIIWIAGFFLFFVLAGFFVVPPLAKHLLIKNLSETLHRDVSIKQIKINPLKLTVAVNGVVVKEKETSETVFSFEEFFANIKAISLFKMAIVINEIRLTKPYVKLIRDEDGSYNFSDLIEKASEDRSPSEKTSKPIQFSINNIIISGGAIDFLDIPKEVFHEITELNLAVPFISNMKYHIETFIQPRLSASVNGDAFVIEGKTKPFADSLETDFDINIKDLDLADYLGYVPTRKHFSLLSGSLNLIAKVAYIQSTDKKPGLEVIGKMELKQINLADEKKNPLFKAEGIDLEIASVKPLEDLVHLANLDIRSPEVTVRRTKDGKIDIVTISSLMFGAAQQQGDTKTSQPARKRESMSVLVDVWRWNDGKVRFLDAMPDEPVTIEIKNAEIEAKNISLAKGSKADLQLSFLLGKPVGERKRDNWS